VRGTPGERILVLDETYEQHPNGGIFEVDAALGYRPLKGGKTYAEHGAKRNDYPLEKRPGKRRLLFLGDSVTDRAKVIDGLHELLGEDYEYWNAGVVGYASQQELGYYRDDLEGIHADHVVLTFHLNDFETTPVTFMHGDELVAVYGRMGTRRANPWLLEHCYLYRFLFMQGLGRTERPRTEAIEHEVEGALTGIQTLARERGTELTVLVLPWLIARDRWSPAQVHNHQFVLDLLERLGIRHYSFLETLDQALADGVDINETPGDVQHPSVEFGKRMAKDLLAQGWMP